MASPAVMGVVEKKASKNAVWQTTGGGLCSRMQSSTLLTATRVTSGLSFAASQATLAARHGTTSFSTPEGKHVRRSFAANHALAALDSF